MAGTKAGTYRLGVLAPVAGVAIVAGLTRKADGTRGGLLGVGGGLLGMGVFTIVRAVLRQ